MASAKLKQNKPIVVLKMTLDEAEYLWWWMRHYGARDSGPVSKALKDVLGG